MHLSFLFLMAPYHCERISCKERKGGQGCVPVSRLQGRDLPCHVVSRHVVPCHEICIYCLRTETTNTSYTVHGHGGDCCTVIDQLADGVQLDDPAIGRTIMQHCTCVASCVIMDRRFTRNEDAWDVIMFCAGAGVF